MADFIGAIARIALGAAITASAGCADTPVRPEPAGQASPAVVAQAQQTLRDGTAVMLGTLRQSPPPVPDPDSFPHAVAETGVDVATTAYLINGHVYAKQFRASGGFTVWFDCGAAPTGS